MSTGPEDQDNPSEDNSASDITGPGGGDDDSSGRIGNTARRLNRS